MADHIFTDMPVNIDPGQSEEYTFIFTDVPVYTDATKWWSDEVDWEFEYLSSS